ncbi:MULTISPECIES: hypothetical protein [Roseomonadaceae]|uniref:NTP pyrophosphohydrolase MazG putative catalytic core domain-containing protein n=1 Tax=Falsiroseomonas oleicola TaxID=2801474 RepID=A0ABS6H6A8_9PROT|nr:hypothetical protein [Roseomonas oleicola]MBU8543974.1 hypothetical protein [Roseomonas oleicola]
MAPAWPPHILEAAALALMTPMAREHADTFHGGRPGPGHIADVRRVLEAVAPHLPAARQPGFDLRAFGVENRTRCEAPNGFGHRLHDWSLSDWMTATLGELGEAANIAKKLNRVRDGLGRFNAETEDALCTKMADEIADCAIYLDLMAQAAGIDLATAIRRKFDRTSAKIGYVAAPGAPAP